MKKMKYLLLMCAMMLVLTACGGKEEVAESTEEAAAETTEEAAEAVQIFGVFDSQTLEGEAVTEEIFAEADLTMVNIWGTFCSPCIAEMPDLGEISSEYADRGFQIVGLMSDVMEPEDATALQIVEQTGADYTHLIASDDLVTNVLQYVNAVPTTVFVDKEGNQVGKTYTGARSKSAWELIINQHLAEVK